MQKIKTILCFILLFLALSHVKAQENSLPQQPDSVIMVLDSALLQPVQMEIESIDDSIRTIPHDSIVIMANELIDLKKTTTFKPDPKKAVIYSAIFPGLGQIYNKKYWKLPILYGGFVGVSYAITWNNSHYADYLEGYKSILRNDPKDTTWENLLPYGRDPQTVDKKWFTGVLKDRKNYFRYYRDLSIIIGVALYGLAIVDAYVDAQLFEFDVSTDLSMRIEPMIFKKDNVNNYLADSYGFKWSISF